MKWEAWLLILILIVLGFVLVYRPGAPEGTMEVQIGQRKAMLVEVERASEEGPRRFERQYRHGGASEIVTESELRRVFGEAEVDRVLAGEGNSLFRLLNISSFASLPWVILGFGAQVVFATRFLIQWIASERRKESVIPVAFWWVSLLGGVALFAYFVWRRDPVGVLGQSSGIVIYGRNLRLIYKQRRRARRVRERELAARAEAEGPSETSSSAPAPDEAKNAV